MRTNMAAMPSPLPPAGSVMMMGTGMKPPRAIQLDMSKAPSCSSMKRSLNQSNSARACQAPPQTATARANAAPHSAVGRVAAYEDAAYAFKDADERAQELAEIAAENPDDAEAQAAAKKAAEDAEEAHQAAAEALAAASNKSVDHAVADAVNDLLGIDMEIPE